MAENNGFFMDRFSYYRSGILLGEVGFHDGKMYRRSMDIETDTWSSWEEDSLPDTDEAFKRVWEVYNSNVFWYGEVNLDSGVSYKKYSCVDAVGGGAGEAVWTWAMEGRGLPVDVVTLKDTILAFIMPDREILGILVKPGFESFTPLQMWDNPLVSEAEFKVSHKGSFYITTRDNVKLATDVWLPEGIEKCKKVPAILVRTPYGRLSATGGPKWLGFVKRGYAIVAQDVRGREDSDGEWVPYKYDAEDGDDTLNWIAGQSWSNGNAGMIGASYLGCVQWSAASSGNSHLKAIVSLVAAGPPFIDIKRKGGIYPSGSLAWSFMMADKRMDRDALDRDDWKEVINIRPIKDIPQRVLGKSIHFWDEYMAHPDYDSFWEKTDWSVHGDKADVPSIIISGWYDDNGMGSTAAWEMNEKYGRENQKLIFGPWKHHFNSAREIHGIKFGKDAVRYDLDVLCLKWFDRFLKDIENGVEDEAAVRYYLLGENRWMDSKKWPPENVVYRNLYIHSGGSANSSSGDGRLSMDIPEDETPDRYTFDPKDPAPFLIDVSENEMNVPGNYMDVDRREDVLVYTSDVLDRDTVIAGNVYGQIYISSSCRDTDFLVRLEDVDGEGNSIRLVDGIMRARYRKSFKEPELLEPGKVEKIEMRMSKIANVFKAGHRMRVTITSGADNLAFPNHNTGNNVPDDVEMITARQTVHHSKEYPSCVRIPVADV